MGVSSDTHASSTSATNTPEAISQISKTENMSNTSTKEWNGGNTESWKNLSQSVKALKKDSKDQSKPKKTIRPESLL